MPTRSQRHLREIRGYDSNGLKRPGFGPPPAITATSPTTTALAAAGAVARTIVTPSATGGTAPYVWTITSAGGLSCNVVAGVVKTTVDPCGTVGAHTLALLCTDSRGQTRALSCVVTLS